MQLKSYKIIELKEKENNMVVEYVFEDEGKEIKSTHTMSYGHDMAYTDFETVMQDTQYIDQNGKIQTKTEQVTRPVVKYRKGFDITDPSVLDSQIKSYAQAYMNGLMQEKLNKVEVSDAVKKLVGVNNTTQIM